MSASEILAGLVDVLPVPPLVEPVAFLEDALLPQELAPVEPAGFALACAQAFWGPRGPTN